MHLSIANLIGKRTQPIRVSPFCASATRSCHSRQPLPEATNIYLNRTPIIVKMKRHRGHTLRSFRHSPKAPGACLVVMKITTAVDVAALINPDNDLIIHNHMREYSHVNEKPSHLLYWFSSEIRVSCPVELSHSTVSGVYCSTLHWVQCGFLWRCWALAWCSCRSR